MTGEFEQLVYTFIRRAVHDELVAMGRAPDQEPELEPLLAAAARLQVSVSWMKARVAEGTLPVYGSGRLRRVKPAEVRALLARRPGPATPEDPRALAQRLLGQTKRR